MLKYRKALIIMYLDANHWSICHLPWLHEDTELSGVILGSLALYYYG
jgi:hypothetical protein